MKRRDFFAAAGASAVALATLPRDLAAQTGSTTAAAEQYPVGDFVVRRAGLKLSVIHRDAPERLLWESEPGGNFLVGEQAVADIKTFGTPEGAYDISDTVSARYENPTIDAISAAGSTASVTGSLSGAGGSIGYTLTFKALSSSHLRFTISVGGDEASGVSRLQLRCGSAADEAFFGFGQQLTYFNQKGYVLPILVQEHGVGRGRPIVTQLVDAFANRGGGNPHITEAPAPHFISSRLRSLFLENTEYSTFDMRHADHVDIKVWSATMTGRILYGESPLDLIEAYTAYAAACASCPTGSITASSSRCRAAPTSCAASSTR